MREFAKINGLSPWAWLIALTDLRNKPKIWGYIVPHRVDYFGHSGVDFFGQYWFSVAKTGSAQFSCPETGGLMAFLNGPRVFEFRQEMPQRFVFEWFAFPA